MKCGSLVVWHGSPVGAFAPTLQVMRLEGKNPRLIAAYGAWTDKFERMEAEFFDAVGVSRKLVTDSEAIVRREKIVPEATFVFDEMTGDYSETTSAGMWIPTTDVMRGYGVDVRNICPTYDADIPATLERLGIRSPYTSAGPTATVK